MHEYKETIFECVFIATPKDAASYAAHIDRLVAASAEIAPHDYRFNPSRHTFKDGTELYSIFIKSIQQTSKEISYMLTNSGSCIVFVLTPKGVKPEYDPVPIKSTQSPHTPDWFFESNIHSELYSAKRHLCIRSLELKMDVSEQEKAHKLIEAIKARTR